MQVVLVMFRSDGQARSFPLNRDITVVGRREDCDLRIPLGEVSRKHCRLIKEGGTLRLEDLGSSNGTHHNGQRIQETVIQPGDTIRIGPVTFVVQIDGVPPDNELQPRLGDTATGDAAHGSAVLDMDDSQGEIIAPAGDSAASSEFDFLADEPQSGRSGPSAPFDPREGTHEPPASSK